MLIVHNRFVAAEPRGKNNQLLMTLLSSIFAPNKTYEIDCRVKNRYRRFIICPFCGARMAFKGTYTAHKRGLFDSKVQVRLSRFICKSPKCTHKASHVILPEALAPHRCYTAPQIALCLFVEGNSWPKDMSAQFYKLIHAFNLEHRALLQQWQSRLCRALGWFSRAIRLLNFRYRYSISLFTSDNGPSVNLAECLFFIFNVIRERKMSLGLLCRSP